MPAVENLLNTEGIRMPEKVHKKGNSYGLRRGGVRKTMEHTWDIKVENRILVVKGPSWKEGQGDRKGQEKGRAQPKWNMYVNTRKPFNFSGLV